MKTSSVRALTVELLGGFRVLTDAGRELRIASRKSRALLACLALQPGVRLSRDFLAALLWEDSDPELARSSMRQALASLRRALPGDCAAALICDHHTVMLDAGLAAVDVSRFLALVRDGSPHALSEAVTRYSSALLEGFDTRASAFENWLEERRRDLRRELLRALERAAAQCVASSDLAGATEVLTRLVAVEPVNERAQRELIELYGRQGRYTEALRQYRTCRDALRRDLDVSPEPATESLYRELLRRRRASGIESDGPEEARTPAATQVRPRESVDALHEAVVMVVRIRTESGRHDDAEALRDLWTDAARRLSAVVEQFGGALDRPGQGEAIAVFGLAATTGNEAERALRSAFALMEDATAGRAIFTIGIAQGQVLSAIDAAPFPIAGRPVVVAQELARSGPPSALLVTADLARRVSERYEFTDAEPGCGIGTRRLVGLRGSPEDARLRRFAGRRAELAMVQTLLERVVDTRRARAVVVRGDPGIGKSALLGKLAEFARSAGVDVYVAHALDFGQAVQQRPLAALAAQLLGLSAEAGETARRAALAAAVEQGLLDAADESPAIEVLGGTSPDARAAVGSTADDTRRERARTRVLSRLIAQRSATRPQMIIVEDAHWADPVEVAQLADLAAVVATQPVLLAVSTRLEGDPISAAWRARARGCPVTTLDLAPLAEDEAHELAAHFEGLPPGTVERCVETAAGHPLFLEQLLRSAQAGEDALPSSVRALLLARVERLPPDSRRQTQAAAILGGRFSIEALRYLLADTAVDVVRLEATGLLLHDGDECRFAHALIRAAIYDSLLRGTRADLHRRAASWYETRDVALHADHLAAAEDPRAAWAQVRAAEVEWQARRLDRALVHARSAQAIACDPRDRFFASVTLGDVLLAQGRTEEAMTAFRESIGLAPGEDELARAWLGLAMSLRIVDRYEDALDALEYAERAAAGNPDAHQLTHLWTLRGNLHFPRGDFDACLHAHQRALEFAEQARSPEDVARALGGLGDAQYQRGRMQTAHDHFERCIDLCEQHGYTGLRLAYLPMLAMTHAYILELATARALCRQTIEGAVRAGDLRAEMLSTCVLASVECFSAQYASSLEHSRRGLVLARELGARRFEAEGVLLRGVALLGLNARNDAAATLEEAAALARSAAATYCGPMTVAALAAATDDPMKCRALLQEGETLLARGAISHNHFEFRLYAIDVCLRLGDPECALRHAAELEHYTREEPLPWSATVISRARTLARIQAQGVNARTVGTVEELLQSAERTGFAPLEPALRRALAAPRLRRTGAKRRTRATGPDGK